MGYLTGSGGTATGKAPANSGFIAPPKPNYGNPFAGDMSKATQGIGTLNQQMGLYNQQYNLNQGELSLRNQQQMAGLGLSDDYTRQRIGFANQGADLAHQLLGWDTKENTINRADYQRNWELEQWRQQNAAAAAGSFVSPGQRFQAQNMADQLMYANQGFDVNAGRIGTRGKQVDVNLAEQLAGYNNQLAQNAQDQKYGTSIFGNQQQQLAVQNQLKQLGLSDQQVQLLLDYYGLAGQYDAYSTMMGQLGNQAYYNPHNYDYNMKSPATAAPKSKNPSKQTDQISTSWNMYGGIGG